MKKSLKTVVLIAGGLNLLMALFHVFLCYRIFIAYGTMPFYPLLQMFAIGGAGMVFFLAATSFFTPSELVSTPIGRAVIILNIFTYSARIAGEFFLSPVQSPAIIGACMLPLILYAYILVNSLNSSHVSKNFSAETA